MKNNFYEVLLVPRDADQERLRNAYQQSLAALVHKLRAARQHGRDTSVLEDERTALLEAWSVLSRPESRQRYDRFLELADTHLPREAEDFWALVCDSMVDPAARATLSLVRTLTDLPVGGGFDAGRTAGRAVVGPRWSAPQASPVASARGRWLEGGVDDQAERTTLVQDAPRIELGGGQASTVAGEPALVLDGMGDGRQEPGLGALEADEPITETVTEQVDSASLATLVFNYGYSGELIRRIRLVREIPLEQVSATTRISQRYLEALEADDYAALPGTTFVRGYLKEIARLLELDAESLIGGYLARMNRARG